MILGYGVVANQTHCIGIAEFLCSLNFVTIKIVCKCWGALTSAHVPYYQIVRTECFCLSTNFQFYTSKNTLIMSLLLVASYTRLSWNLLLANITTPLELLYPILFPITGWTNWPINEFHISKLNWRQFIVLCQYETNVDVIICGGERTPANVSSQSLVLVNEWDVMKSCRQLPLGLLVVPSISGLLNSRR